MWLDTRDSDVASSRVACARAIRMTVLQLPHGAERESNTRATMRQAIARIEAGTGQGNVTYAILAARVRRDNGDNLAVAAVRISGVVVCPCSAACSSERSKVRRQKRTLISSEAMAVALVVAAAARYDVSRTRRIVAYILRECRASSSSSAVRSQTLCLWQRTEEAVVLGLRSEYTIERSILRSWNRWKSARVDPG